MTLDQLRAIPSRDRDALIAVKWFGWQWYHFNGFVTLESPERIAKWAEMDLGGKIVESPKGLTIGIADWPAYGADGNAMLELLERLKSAGYLYHLVNRTGEPKHGCAITYPEYRGWVEATAPTLPEAIQLAALMVDQ